MQHHRSPSTSSRSGTATSRSNSGDTVYSYRDDTTSIPDYDVWKRSFDDAPRQRRSVSAQYLLSRDAELPSQDTGYSNLDATALPTFPPATAAVLTVPSDENVPTAGVRRSGAHRIPAPPSALKGRVAIVAVAAGAVVAAGQAALREGPATVPAEDSSEVALAAGAAPVAAVGVVDATQVATDTSFAAATSTGAPVVKPSNSATPQILNVAAAANLDQFSALLEKGQKFSEQREAREAAARRPMFVLPAAGTYTSGFGARWGTLHAGVDIANAIGTPIFAVADGTVIDSGPAAGFGMWVRIQHSDGTITVYGHIDSSEVQVGQKVMAGDEIAKMGNRGQSTGPHLHFEVHLGGENKIDPLPWLATRGIALGPERD